MCGCVHGSAQSFCTVHCMRVVKCIQFTRLPVLLAWEHKCFFICVCPYLYAVVSLSNFPTVSFGQCNRVLLGLMSVSLSAVQRTRL